MGSGRAPETNGVDAAPTIPAAFFNGQLYK